MDLLLLLKVTAFQAFSFIRVTLKKKRFEVNVGARSDALAVSSDGGLIATGHFHPPIIQLWNGETGELIGTMEGHEAWVSALKFSADGNRLFSGSADQTIRIWDVSTRESLAVYRGHNDEVWSLDLSSDGSQIVSTGKDHSVRIWPAVPASTKDPIERFLEQVNDSAIATSPDGDAAIMAGIDRNDSSLVRFYEIGERGRLKERKYRVENKSIREVSLSWDLNLWVLIENEGTTESELIHIELGGDNVPTVASHRRLQ
jgi:WD40 repeat protein